jgi:hypothetical protein
MWSPLKKGREECGSFREALEENPSVAALEPALREHAAACADCQAAADELLTSRELLKVLASHANAPRPWFAPRVMAAIAAREGELRRSLEAWTAVPKLAAKLTWASAAVLLVASTWLYQRPAFTPAQPAVMDSVFENAPPTSSNDDVLVNWAGRAQ